jgi:dTDP-4-amino-4,6-dideoxygalactose transaminase
LRIDFESAGISRTRLITLLREQGIGSQVHYIPVPMQPLYRAQGSEIAVFPNARSYYEQALSIPLYCSLSDYEQTRVIDVLKELLG